MSYIFIDESGDLGDKGSKYFVLAAILVEDYRTLDNLINKTRRIFKKEIGQANEIKGSETPPKVKKRILKKLNQKKFKAFFIVFDKKYKYKLDYDNDNNILYDILSSHLAKLIAINDSTFIFVDRKKNKKSKMEDFNKLFKDNLKNSKRRPIFIKHVDSKKYKGIQIADLMSWSVYQYFENNNDEYVNLIKNYNLKIVFED